MDSLVRHALYVGETSKTLNVRKDEHLAGKIRKLTPTLGKHRNDVHNRDNFEIICTILMHERFRQGKMLEAPVVNNHMSVYPKLLTFRLTHNFMNYRL